MSIFIGGILFFIVLYIAFVAIEIKFPEIKGAYGKRLVNKALHKLDSNYKVYHDIYMPNEKGTTQIDHIITSPYGIFVLETKHYNGWIFGAENQKFWTQVIYKRKEKFYNPIWQNYGHIKSLKCYLGKKDMNHFYSIIVFSTQSTFKFKENFSSAKVVQIPQLVKVIKEKSEMVLSKEELNEIHNKLDQLALKNNIEKRTLKKEHIQNLKKR